MEGKRNNERVAKVASDIHRYNKYASAGIPPFSPNMNYSRFSLITATCYSTLLSYYPSGNEILLYILSR